jgi:hypothetical protein
MRGEVREISQQFPPTAGAQQVFSTRQHLIVVIILHHNPGRAGALYLNCESAGHAPNGTADTSLTL